MAFEEKTAGFGGLRGFGVVLGGVGVLLGLVGCNPAGRWPARAHEMVLGPAGERRLGYDLDGDGRAEYQQELNEAGRVVVLEWFNDAGGLKERVVLGEMAGEELIHVTIALDGVPYDLLDQVHEEGGFRLFYEPAPLLSTFPAMTDLAFNRMFHTPRPAGYQALYYDPELNEMVGGNDLYLSGATAAWAEEFEYRASYAADAWAYVLPKVVFEHEMRQVYKVLSETQEREVQVYFVGAAGLGTSKGREAIMWYLRQIDRLCERVTAERGGRMRFTVLADHGHNMSGRERVSFKKRLEKAGYRVRDRIEGDRDVVTIEYGLVTYAAFCTRDPAGVALVALSDPAVELAVYPVGERVAVRTINERGWVDRRGDFYRYEAEVGDPLRLVEIVERLAAAGKLDGEGWGHERDWFEATVGHYYPDPLWRIWDGFTELVEYPPDLVVCLADGWTHGNAWFDAFIGGARSTHGSLNRLNSTTGVLTMEGELPGAMRVSEVMAEIEGLKKNF